MTRWITWLITLESFAGQLHLIPDFLLSASRPQTELLELFLALDLTEEFLDDLIAFFKCFNRGIKVLEGDQQPTLQIVVSVYAQLLSDCGHYKDDMHFGGIATQIASMIKVQLPVLH